jgi:excisionase family DNA binding protein
MSTPMHVVTQIPRIFYGVDEAAHACGISRRAVYLLLGRGELRSVKLGGRRLIPVRELERILAAEHASA